MQNYPSPIPNGEGFRYSQKGYTRQEVGGCGFWNHDANEANATMLPTIDSAVFKGAEEAKLSNLKTMNISSAFNGRRLCEKGVGLLEEEGLCLLEIHRCGQQDRVDQPGSHDHGPVPAV